MIPGQFDVLFGKQAHRLWWAVTVLKELPMTQQSLVLRIGRLLLVVALVLGILPVPIGSGHSVQAAEASSMHFLFGSGSATGGKNITLRIKLSSPAPAGGALVQLHANSSLIPVPATMLVPAGTSQRTFHVWTNPTHVTKNVRVSATYGGVTKSRVVKIIEPHLSSMSVQTKMRAGGRGKVTVRLSGRGYPNGVTVKLTSSRPDIVQVPASVVVAPGAASYILIVEPTSQFPDIPVSFTASYDGNQVTKGTIVRWYGPKTTPTVTVSVSPSVSPSVVTSETATAEASATNSANETATSVAATAEASATNAANETATSVAATAEASA
ncbi:MAG TPA: hypothetical protein PK819_01810, partial [Thermomicrobiales bacterium]|nr:hypothetical protein [Thermomicrobiales bacterium]